MKLNSLLSILAVASVIMFSGCTKQEDGDFMRKVSMTFRADMEPRSDEAVDTKTTLVGSNDDSKRSVYWLPQDQIGISSGSGFSLFTYQGTEPAANAEFSGQLTKSDKYYAFYPYSQSASMASNVLSITLPSTQFYQETTFDNGAFPMVAVSSTPELHFKNLCGVLKLNLLGNVKVTSITFSAKDEAGNNIKVSGEATVDMSYESIPDLRMSASAQDTVTLKCKNGVQLNSTTATPFYIVLPPITYSDFTLVITSEDDIMTKASSSLTINRSNIRPTDDLVFTPSPAIYLSENGTANCYIVPRSGKYSIDANVIGNGPAGLLPDIAQDVKKFHTTSAIITPLSAKLIWEDVEGLISNVALDSEGKLNFKASSQKGNALVAVYDNANPSAEGAKILWSWHIWRTDVPSDETYLNWDDREFTVIDRNLGATASDVGSGADSEYLSTLGLLYQWGRKDPFPGGGISGYGKEDEKPLYGDITFINYESITSVLGTITGSINNPFSFITAEFTWLYDGDNWYLWGNPFGYNYKAAVPYSSDGTTSDNVVTPKKTIYDPCPSGYMVAPMELWTGFSTLNYSSISSLYLNGYFNRGWHFYCSAAGSGPTAWYPGQSGRRGSTGELFSPYDIGHSSSWYSSSPYNAKSGKPSMMHFDKTNERAYLMSSYSFDHYGSSSSSYAFPIRCIRSEEIVPDITSPTLASSEASSITPYGARVGGTVSSLNGANVTRRGIIYSITENPTSDTGTTLTSPIPNGTNGKGVFAIDITGLSLGTTYYYKAFATNVSGTTYGSELSFTTISAEIAPEVATGDISKVTSLCVFAEGEVLSAGGNPVTKRGFCWSTSETPTIENDTIVAGSSVGAFSGYIRNLSPSTTYYVRAYATNGIGTSYGEQKIVTTLTSSSQRDALIALYNATDGDNWIDNTNWCTEEPISTWFGITVDDNSSSDPVVKEINLYKNRLVGEIPAEIKLLTRLEKFNIGSNSGYNVISGTLDLSGMTSLKEVNCYNIGISELNVTGCTAITRILCHSNKLFQLDFSTNTALEELRCYSNYSLTSLDLSANTSLSTLGCYNCGLTSLDLSTNTSLRYLECDYNYLTSLDLSANTSLSTLYCYDNYLTSLDIRALTSLTNLYCGSQRDNISLVLYLTSAQLEKWSSTWVSSGSNTRVTPYIGTSSLPVLSTKDITSITHNSASSGGNVTSAGGSSITQRGICWSTSRNPSITSTSSSTKKTTDGTGGGSFTSSMTGLSQNTTYYVRAYAVNSLGVSYGEEKKFTTSMLTTPTVTTTQATSITDVGAVSGGTITSNGGADITARGVVWSTSTYPSVNLSTKTSDGTGTEAFTSTISGLSPGTTYYYRAYATNSQGTSYGELMTFTTKRASGDNDDDFNNDDNKYQW